MRASCSRLDGYVDGGLTDAERDAFESHLLACEHCQAALEDGMQIAAAGVELADRADRPRAAIARVRHGRWLAIAAVAASATAAVVVWRVTAHEVSLEERVASTLGPKRDLLARLPYAPLDRYRPYDTPRGDVPAGTVPLALTAEVERHGTAGALGSVLIARRDLPQAAALLKRSGGDEVALAWSALELTRGHYVDVLRHADAVLAKSPRQPVAAWNRAMALEKLELPLAAAEMFEIVAAANEPGWAAEARTHAGALESREHQRQASWLEIRAACDALGAGKLADLAVLERGAAVCRPSFYKAVRIAHSKAARAALEPVAKIVDAGTGATAAQDLLRAASNSPTRDRAVEIALALEAPAADQAKLLDDLRALGHEDLILSAVFRAGLRGEYIERALRSKNPYFVEIAHERQAQDMIAQGDPLRAEALLLPLTKACAASSVELRCAYLHFELANAYLAMHRPEKTREVLLAGLRRSRALGSYWEERLYFDYFAEVARLDVGGHAEMRAYLREATLRSGAECDQQRFALETLAEAGIDALAFVQARRDLTAAPLCGAPPNLNRLRALAELAHVDGTPADLAAAKPGFAAARAKQLSVGERALLDATEGRLLAPTDPEAATALLLGAIAATRGAQTADVNVAKARADAFAQLIVLAAAREDGEAMLRLFAEATGVTDQAPCTLGAMVDAERVVVVVKTPGATLQHFKPQGRQTAVVDARSLVPPEIRKALEACARVDVLALPPVFGLPELLPPEIAWSYRGRTARVTSPLPAKPTVFVVADTRPPSDLELAPLSVANLAPIPSASYIELRGDAASPERTLAGLPRGDAIEIHSHGYMNLGANDASLIALSPGNDGKFSLDARAIAAQPLPKAPVVILAACHAGYSAPYRHESWGLPRAFLLAGARVVLASPDAIPDADAALFRAVEARILAGVDPAVALRDARVTAAPWARSILLFD